MPPVLSHKIKCNFIIRTFTSLSYLDYIILWTHGFGNDILSYLIENASDMIREKANISVGSRSKHKYELVSQKIRFLFIKFCHSVIRGVIVI